eukprot:2734547-Pyramimonas_sp.AAC.1
MSQPGYPKSVGRVRVQQARAGLPRFPTHATWACPKDDPVAVDPRALEYVGRFRARLTGPLLGLDYHL